MHSAVWQQHPKLKKSIFSAEDGLSAMRTHNRADRLCSQTMFFLMGTG